MKTKASARFVKISPRKARIVANLVRGKNAGDAIRTLTFVNRAGSLPIRKVLESAIANAKQADAAIDLDLLYIQSLQVDMGPTSHMRRWRPRAMGRATRIVKGTSHINVVLAVR